MEGSATANLAQQLCGPLYANNSTLSSSVAAAIASATSVAAAAVSSKDVANPTSYPQCSVSFPTLQLPISVLGHFKFEHLLTHVPRASKIVSTRSPISIAGAFPIAHVFAQACPSTKRPPPARSRIAHSQILIVCTIPLLLYARQTAGVNDILQLFLTLLVFSASPFSILRMEPQLQCLQRPQLQSLRR